MRIPAAALRVSATPCRIPTVPPVGGAASLATAYPNMSAVPVEEIANAKGDAGEESGAVGGLLNNPVKL